MFYKVLSLLFGTAVALSFSVTVFAQNSDLGTVDQRNRVKSCDTLWYYGLDLSHVRVTDGPKISRCETYRVAYPPAWIAFVEKELPPYNYVKPALKKGVFHYVSNEVQDHTQEVNKYFIIGTNYSFPSDTVVKAVRSYKLSQQNGIGLVIIAENFNKNKEASSSWVTFFDIRSREVLWSVRVSGRCKHMGYTAHWGSGVVDGFRNFISSVYKDAFI
jgi:hypothetical protein